MAIFHLDNAIGVAIFHLDNAIGVAIFHLDNAIGVAIFATDYELRQIANSATIYVDGTHLTDKFLQSIASLWIVYFHL